MNFSVNIKICGSFWGGVDPDRGTQVRRVLQIRRHLIGELKFCVRRVVSQWHGASSPELVKALFHKGDLSYRS